MLRSFISSVPRPPRISPRLRATRRPLRGVAQPTSREGTEIERHLAKTLQHEISSEPDTKITFKIEHHVLFEFGIQLQPLHDLPGTGNCNFRTCRLFQLLFAQILWWERGRFQISDLRGKGQKQRRTGTNTLESCNSTKPLCSVYVCTQCHPFFYWHIHKLIHNICRHLELPKRCEARYNDYWMKNCELLQLDLPQRLSPIADSHPSLPAAALADTEEKEKVAALQKWWEQCHFVRFARHWKKDKYDSHTSRLQ